MNEYTVIGQLRCENGAVIDIIDIAPKVGCNLHGEEIVGVFPLERKSAFSYYTLELEGDGEFITDCEVAVPRTKTGVIREAVIGKRVGDIPLRIKREMVSSGVYCGKVGDDIQIELPTYGLCVPGSMSCGYTCKESCSVTYTVSNDAIVESMYDYYEDEDTDDTTLVWDWESEKWVTRG